MPLEEMGAFFEARLEGYEEHMLTNIQGAEEFYPFTAESLPDTHGARILDLGCGTGLELRWLFQRDPSVKITGIDLSQGMLSALRERYPAADLELIRGSYFDIPLGERQFDAAVSVESLHHFTKDEKVLLYKKLHRALKPGGVFILTDYFSLSEEEEHIHRAQLLRLKAQQGLGDDVLYHFDTPLTVAHELEALQEAGFAFSQVLRGWGATHTIRAVKGEAS